jgi:isopenicillin N synthase-like dioxygenase
VARQIDAACTDIGFFMVVGHGVPQGLITTARQRAIDFFALPVEEKMKVQRPPAKISRGYNWVGDRSLAYSMGQAAPPDIQEAFAFGPDSTADLAARLKCTHRTFGRNARMISGTSCSPIAMQCQGWRRKFCALWRWRST